MPLRIETCNNDFTQWGLSEVIFPGYIGVFDQILVDGDKVYVVYCSENDKSSIIYQNKIDAAAFRERISGEGVCMGEDAFEHRVIKKGESYEMSVKTTLQQSRQVLRFTQE